jgi:Flp pilus assembly pilin Flp
MLRRTVQRLVWEDDGVEMIEWAIVGVVFAVAAGILWTDLATNIDAALNSIGDLLEADQASSGEDGIGNGVGGDPDGGKSTCC